jgi:Zn-finger nucleic acid-binding protein
MQQHDRGGISVAQCPSCEGLFLRGADRGLLIEQENDWHVSSGPTTQPVPRITADMAVPQLAMPAREARAYLDELFG